MSQSGRLTTNQPVPGAGIQTVTGNLGGAVPGDGAANIDLIGVGGIIVTGIPGANTLQISSGAVAASYTTDTGVAVPDGAGNLNVVGGTNINTDNAIANTVTINLDDNVTITGDFQAHNITATNDITANTGDIATAVGNILSAGIVQATLGGLFDDVVRITSNGIDSTGPTILRDLNRGVVQVDATDTLFSDEGINGQILIGSTTGPALWRTITGAGGIVVGNGANAITLICDGTVPQLFPTDAGNAIPLAGSLEIFGGTNINTSGAANTVTVNLDDDVTLAGFLHAGTDIAAGTSLSVGTYADIGSYANVGGTLTVTGASTFNNNVTINGLTTIVGNTRITGNLDIIGIGNTITSDLINVNTLTVGLLAAITNQPNGVLFTNGAGNISATNAAQGSLIMGQGVGVQPAWGTLTSTGGSIAITTPTANTINLEVSTAVVHSSFSATLNTENNVSGNGTIHRVGSTTATTIDYNIGGDYYPGNGAGIPAYYTAPNTGTYIFTFNLTAKIALATFPFMYGGTAMTWYITDTVNKYGQVSLPTRNRVPNFVSAGDWIIMPGSTLIYLAAGARIYMEFISYAGGSNVDSIKAGSFAGYFLG